MKQSGGLQRRPWVPTAKTIARDRQWRRDSQQVAIQRARQAPTRRPVHTPASVVDLIIARSVRAFGFEVEDFPRGLCELCGKPAINTHTRRPNGMGGTNRPESYQASAKVRVCGHGNTDITTCHGRIEQRRTWATLRGLLVPQEENPATTPVLLAVDWVLLDDSGGWTPADSNSTNPARGAA